MRFRADHKAVRNCRTLLLISSGLALAACNAAGSGPAPALASAGLPATGPQADYPITIGDPYTVDGTTYTPVDQLNYDEVGFLSATDGVGVTGAHHTLPVPSYVEVTSLETGRTILVRLEKRGPMDSNHLIALAPAALAQLGASADTPVRVRRVNPPEEQRAMLRAGAEAPLRMDTPMSLVEVLRRRLPDEGSVSLRASAAQVLPADTVLASERDSESPAIAEAAELPDVELTPVERAFADVAAEAAAEEAPSILAETPDTAEQPAVAEVIAEPAELAASNEEGFVVQAATFSTEERAANAADALGGHISPSGKYFRVRTGPFETREQAEASLANVQAAGYSDARIYTNG